MLFDKLRQIEERSNEITRLLSDPAIFSQPAEYARLRKEHADTLEVVERFTTYREVLRRIRARPRPRRARAAPPGVGARPAPPGGVPRAMGGPRHILAEGGDRELAELAQ